MSTSRHRVITHQTVSTAERISTGEKLNAINLLGPQKIVENKKTIK
jgi:hypothetical protein